MLAADIDNASDLVAQIREVRTLADVPIVASVEEIDEEYLDGLFKSGIDDYHFIGSQKQFISLVATVAKSDSWSAIRAPAGQVIFADPERMERIRFGRVLRRNGFDTFFAGNAEELETAVNTVDARMVIASTRLEGGDLVDVIRAAKGGDESPPWIVITTPDEADQLGERVPKKPEVVFFEAGSDAEGITFFMNELLAPPPVGARKSPRVLYNVPVSFVPHGGKVPFWGFTFNINLGGLYVRSLTSFPLQTPIDLVFRPPFGRGQVFATAQVVWQKKYGDTTGAASPPGMGIQFLEMWQADKAAYDTGYRILLEENHDKPTSSLGPKSPLPGEN